MLDNEQLAFALSLSPHEWYFVYTREYRLRPNGPFRSLNQLRNYGFTQKLQIPNWLEGVNLYLNLEEMEDHQRRALARALEA